MNLRSLLTLFFLAFAALHFAEGQGVPPPSPSRTKPTTTTRKPQQPDPLVAPNSAGTSALLPDVEDFSDKALGAIRLFNPSIRYSVQYGDGIGSRPGQRVKTTIHRLTPRVALRFAERITFSYSPSFTWYSSDALNDRIDHAAALSAYAIVQDWQLGFGQTYVVSEVPVFETASQTHEEMWGTNLSLDVPLGTRTSVNAGFGQVLRDTRDFTEVKSWSGNASFNHQYRPDLRLGVGVGGTYSAIEPGHDLFSRQLNGKLEWNPTDRLHVGLTAGVDISRFIDSERGDITNPVYSGDIVYQLFETTSLTFGGRRAIGASYFANLIQESAQYKVGLSQRLLGLLYLNTTIAHSQIDYVSAVRASVIEDREDERWSYSASLSTSFLQRFSTSISWQHSRSDSNISDFTFDSTIVGLTLGWKY